MYRLLKLSSLSPCNQRILSTSIRSIDSYPNQTTCTFCQTNYHNIFHRGKFNYLITFLGIWDQITNFLTPDDHIITIYRLASIYETFTPESRSVFDVGHCRVWLPVSAGYIMIYYIQLWVSFAIVGSSGCWKKSWTL